MITHQETKFVGLRLMRGVFVTVPIHAPWSLDKNTPIGIVGGVGVYSVRIAQLRKGLSGADQ